LRSVGKAGEFALVHVVEWFIQNNHECGKTKREG
jgi:hypothetical protein